MLTGKSEFSIRVGPLMKADEGKRKVGSGQTGANEVNLRLTEANK